MGSYLSFEGTSFTWMPGAGADNAPGGAFYTPTDGWLEGPVQITTTQQPARLVGWPVSARAPFTAVAPAPGSPSGTFNAQALAVGADGVVARYTPGHGWEREFLQTSSGAVSSPTLRAVAWPEPNRAFAVGDLGAMWIWRAETGLWEKDPAAPLDGFQGNLDGIAFDPSEPGARLRRRPERRAAQIRQELDTGRRTPAGFKEANFTSVAFAGSEAMVAAEHDLLVNEGSGWKVEPEVHALLASLPKPPSWMSSPGCQTAVPCSPVATSCSSATAPGRHGISLNSRSSMRRRLRPRRCSKDRKCVRCLSVVPDVHLSAAVDPAAGRSQHAAAADSPQPTGRRRLSTARNGRRLGGRGARGYAGDSQDKPLKADPIAALDIGTIGPAGRWEAGAARPTTRDAVAAPAVAPVRPSAKTCRPQGSTATPRPAIRRPQPVRQWHRSRCRAGPRRSRSAATPTASNRALRLPTRRSHPTAISAPRLARSPASQRSRTVRACCSIRAGARPQARDPSRRLRPTAMRS